ncbi:hypothetical protein VTI74DRAFT_2814 [Chaetomium olivicolor]
MHSERQPLLERQESSPDTESPKLTRRQRAAWYFAIAYWFLIPIFTPSINDLVKVPFYRSRCLKPQPQPPHGGTNNTPPVLLTYPGERISWTPCGTLANRTLECSNITVPMDHFHTPTHNGVTDLTNNFTIPLVRLRSNKTTSSSNERLPNILLNPGGPGGSGTNLVHRRGAQLADIVGDGFHLLGFDPRGVNQSVPLATCYPDQQTRVDLSGVRNKKVEEDSGELWAWTSNFVRACSDTMSEHGKYVNTPQTAADMNWILDAVGQRGLYYWGFSYGTLLGQTYATMFPERAERVIIDGVANQFDWYDSLIDGERLADTDGVFDVFVEE